MGGWHKANLPALGHFRMRAEHVDFQKLPGTNQIVCHLDVGFGRTAVAAAFDAIAA